jgi:predicted O-methyltransferase YrrM
MGMDAGPMNMDAGFCPELQELLALERISTTSPNNLRIITTLMKAKPLRTLETGLASGGSALAFTDSHRRNGAIPSRQHVAIDPLQESLFANEGLRNIDRAGLSGYLDFRREIAALAMADLLRSGEKFDLIYLDGSHFFDEVLLDAYYSIRLLNDGGILLFDDSTIPDVAKVIRYLRRNQAQCLAEVNLTDIHPTGRSIKYQLARWVGRAQMTAFRRHGTFERSDWNLRIVDF